MRGSQVFRIRKRLRFSLHNKLRKQSAFAATHNYNDLITFYFPNLDPVDSLQDHQGFAALADALLSTKSSLFLERNGSGEEEGMTHFLLLMKWTSQNFPLNLQKQDAPLASVLSSIASRFPQISQQERQAQSFPTLQELSLSIISNIIAVDPHSNSKYFDLIQMASSFLSALSHSFSSLPSTLLTELVQFLTNVVISGAPLPVSEINPFLIALCQSSPLPLDCGIPLFLAALSSSSLSSHLNIFAMIRICSRYLFHESESALQALSRFLDSQQARFLIVKSFLTYTRLKKQGQRREMELTECYAGLDFQSLLVQVIKSSISSHSSFFQILSYFLLFQKADNYQRYFQVQNNNLPPNSNNMIRPLFCFYFWVSLISLLSALTNCLALISQEISYLLYLISVSIWHPANFTSSNFWERHCSWSDKEKMIFLKIQTSSSYSMKLFKISLLLWILLSLMNSLSVYSQQEWTKENTALSRMTPLKVQLFYESNILSRQFLSFFVTLFFFYSKYPLFFSNHFNIARQSYPFLILRISTIRFQR